VSSDRILHFMGTNFGMTGVETFMLELCSAQKASGARPAMTMELENRAELQRLAEAADIPVYDFPHRSAFENRVPRKVGTAMLRTRRIGALVRLLRHHDILHVHAVGISGMEALLAAAVARTRTIVVTHQATISYFAPMRSRTSDFTFWLEKRLACTAGTPYGAATDELVAHGIPRRRSFAIPLCVDQQRFTESAIPPAPGELRLVMAARMYEGKGHDHLLRAMASLHGRYPGVTLLLLGDGPMRPAIEADIKRLGLSGVVELKGRVDLADMPALLRTAHVIVLPSHMSGETFPVCLLEGMSMGLPAIGTRWFGIPDIIADGETGFIVEPRDPVGLADAIERFLLDPELYGSASRKAAERVRAYFTATAVARAYQQLYDAGPLS
jgi:glycosyltransferase involved in cell wall biosynthesis